MRKLGTLEPVFYFVNGGDPSHPSGYVLLAPYSDCPTPPGYRRDAAETLGEVDRLQERLQRQERDAWEREAEADARVGAERIKQVRDNLYARMVSSSTSEYEKEFIRCYLQLREEKRAKHQQRFTERVAYLHAREFDTPRGRGVDEEKVSLDRIEVKA